MGHAAFFRRIIAGMFVGFSLISAIPSLYAQRTIDKIQIDKAVPGQVSNLTVTGTGFSNVTNVEVEVDGVTAEVQNWTMISDTELRIAIRFPRTGRSGRRHTYSVRVYGEGRAETLTPRPVTPVVPEESLPTLDTVAVTPAPPPMPGITFLLDGQPIPDDAPLVVNFETISVDSPASKTLTIHNTGQASLRLSNLQKPAAFEVVGFPERIPVDSTATIAIRWQPRSSSNSSGTLSFNTNIPSRPVLSLQLSGTVSSSSVVWPFGIGLRTLFFIIAAIVVLAAGLFLIRRIGAKKSIHIKTEKDLGRQEITSGKSIRMRFQLALTPRLDFGQSTIQAKGDLIAKSKSTKAAAEVTPPEAA